MSPPQDTPQPPQPPEIKQRINLSRQQLIGLPLLILIPVLALFGVFGMTQGRGVQEGEALELSVDYTTRTRLRADYTLIIEVRNRLERPLDGVTVEIDRDYLEGFSEVEFTPSATTVTDDTYRIDLGTIPAAATRIVDGDLVPTSYWSHHGSVTVSASETEAVEFAIATFVFP